MYCGKCGGRAFLDRTFTENKSYETFCLICGERKFISKHSKLGKWITKLEKKRESAATRDA